MSGQGDVRARLVDCAVALVEEAGLAGFTGREVARRAGVSHGAPRRHFSSRAALLSAVAARGFVDLTRSAQAAVDASAAPADQLRAAASAYLDFARDRPAMFELMFRNDLLEASGQNLRASSLPAFDLLTGVVATCVPGHDPHATALDLWVSLHGLAVLTSRRALPVVTDEPAERLLDRLLDAAIAGTSTTGPASPG